MSLDHLPEQIRPLAAEALEQLAAPGWIEGNLGFSADRNSVNVVVDGRVWQISLMLAPGEVTGLLPMTLEQAMGRRP